MVSFMKSTAAPDFSLTRAMHARWNRVGRRLAFKARTAAEWRAWRRRLLAELKSLTGYDTLRPCTLQPRVDARTDRGDHWRERVVIRTEADVYMPFYVLIPKTGAGPFPAVLCPHGHCGGGKTSTSGEREADPRMPGIIDQYNYDYGVQFARAGAIAFCPDARGFGERRYAGHPDLLDCTCRLTHNMAIPLGLTITAQWAWDLHRLLDYAATRRDCLPGRIGCAGLSGGGLQALWASALDTRIRAAVISGYFYGYRESLLDQPENCSCNYVPHLYETADMGDIGALILPRPVLIETGTVDPLNGASGLKNVRSQVAILKRAASLLNAPEAVAHDVFEGDHKWHGTVSVPWMMKQLAR
jgi:dienelactone hydrolase